MPWSSGPATTVSWPANHLADAGWDVIVVEAADHPVAPSGRAPSCAGFRRRPLLVLLPDDRRLAGDAGAPPRRPRSRVVARPVGARSPATRRSRRRAVPRPGADRRGHRRGSTRRRGRVAGARRRMGPLRAVPPRCPAGAVPPVRPGIRLGLAARLDLWDLLRRTVLPVRALGAELFAGEVGPLLLAGNALTPMSPPTPLRVDSWAGCSSGSRRPWASRSRSADRDGSPMRCSTDSGDPAGPCDWASPSSAWW